MFVLGFTGIFEGGDFPPFCCQGGLNRIGIFYPFELFSSSIFVCLFRLVPLVRSTMIFPFFSRRQPGTIPFSPGRLVILIRRLEGPATHCAELVAS